MSDIFKAIELPIGQKYLVTALVPYVLKNLSTDDLRFLMLPHNWPGPWNADIERVTHMATTYVLDRLLDRAKVARAELVGDVGVMTMLAFVEEERK